MVNTSLRAHSKPFVRTDRRGTGFRPVPRLVEVALIILHEADLPDFDVDLPGAHELTGEPELQFDAGPGRLARSA
jgi:hypothetical protein